MSDVRLGSSRHRLRVPVSDMPVAHASDDGADAIFHDSGAAAEWLLCRIMDRASDVALTIGTVRFCQERGTPIEDRWIVELWERTDRLMTRIAELAGYTATELERRGLWDADADQ